MDEYLTLDEEGWKLRLEGIDADIVCVGHSHVPFHLNLGKIQVVNPGSVGQPRDGDWRASYAMIDNGQVSLHRAEYDLAGCLDQMRSVGVPPWSVRLSEEVLRRGGDLAREEMDAIQ
jgi:diadenosine tetraphosphatase ApaH/serine/threonine PP2A family protein phosphatase